VISVSGAYIRGWGRRALICAGRRAYGAVQKQLLVSLDEAGVGWESHRFVGECCDENIQIMKQKARSSGADIIIGVGGGKALDSSKAAAELCNIPVVCIPTIAATCAATTALSVVYNTEGVFERIFFLTTNPHLVLVDPAVIAGAPSLYLVSGVLDSLAKWYEGKAVFPTISHPDVNTSSAMSLAGLLYEQMRQKAVRAVGSIQKQRVENYLIYVIDLIVLLTGIIQSLGLATLRGGIAHAVHNGLTILKESHSILHGIKVGYGIAVQLIMERVPQGDLDDTISFFKELDFIPSFKALNLPYRPELVENIAEKAANDPYVGKMPFPVKKEMIVSAMGQLEDMPYNK
jgi:glycerol dehydrogenase